jgi:glycosyltransferase involved in cell wall biosynthesis
MSSGDSIRIGADLSAIQPTKSGVDWYTHNVILNMMDLLQDGEELVLFSNRDTGFEDEAAHRDGVEVVRSGFRFQEPWRQFILPALLRRHRIDVCFFTNFVSALASPCATVLTIHDLSIKLFPRTHSLRNVLWARSLMPLSIRRSAHVIADSNNTRLDLVRVMGVPGGKVDVIHLGTSPEFCPEPGPDEEKALAYFGIDRPYVLFVGTLEPRKNINMLIKAFDRVAASRPDLHLVLAGRRGWMAQAIFDELERRSLLGRVHITGYVPDEYLPPLYRQAEALVYPSLYEGFGLPPLEAMSSGTPVVVSRNSSLPEVVGDAGLYVDALSVNEIAGAMERILDDAALADSLRQKGLERAGRFTWPRAAAKTLEILRKVAHGDA